MTPEEMGRFAETAYLLGSAVAESVWSADIESSRRNEDRRRWAVFCKRYATTDELLRVAEVHFWDGYDDTKNRIEPDRMR